MKITMLGTGYVGLVSGTCFSEFGFDVCCVDKDKDKITNLKKNVIPIYEPGLENLVKKNKDANRLTFSSDVKKIISEKKVFYNHKADKKENKWNAAIILKKEDENLLPSYIMNNKIKFKDWLD